MKTGLYMVNKDDFVLINGVCGYKRIQNVNTRIYGWLIKKG